MTSPFKPNPQYSYNGSDADVSMDTSDNTAETVLSSPPRAPRSILRNNGESLPHRLFADDVDEEEEEEEDEKPVPRSPVLKPLDLNLDLGDVFEESAKNGKSKQRKRVAEHTVYGRDLSFDDVVDSPVNMNDDDSQHISPSCYKSPANVRSAMHKSPSSFRTLDGRMVTSKNPFSPMLTEDHPVQKVPLIGGNLSFPVSLDDAGSKKLAPSSSDLPVLSQRLQKREPLPDFLRDGYPAKSGEFRGFSGSPIREVSELADYSNISYGYNTHKVRRINLNDDVVAAKTEEVASWKKKLYVKTASQEDSIHDNISPTDVLSFPMQSPIPPTPTKPRQNRRPHVKRYTPIRKQTLPNTPMPQRRTNKARSSLDSTDSNSEGSPEQSSRFHSDFDVIGELGTGSFGSVLKVLSRLDGCMYAIKVAHRAAKGNSDRDRMLKEVYALAALSDQGDPATFHIVRYHQAWMEESRLYIQTELCTTTLAAEMKQEKLTTQRKYKFLREIAVALEFIHKNGMVHLDIKPENIFVKNDQFKLGDFGLVSKVSNHKDVEEGDSRYMSKELLSGEHADLTKSDIFSLGITLYEICLGGDKDLPHNGPEWQDLRAGNLPIIANTPLEMYNFMKIMMNPSYAARPSASDLLKRPQLFSPEQLALLIEKNKVKQANLALAEQTDRLRKLAPPAPSMPRKGALMRRSTWSGGS